MIYIHLKVKHRLKDIVKKQMLVFLFLVPILKKDPIILLLGELMIGKFWIWWNLGSILSNLLKRSLVQLMYLIKSSPSLSSKAIYGKLINHAVKSEIYSLISSLKITKLKEFRSIRSCRSLFASPLRKIKEFI